MLQVLVVDQVDRQAVLAMGVEQVPGEAAIHERAVKAGAHAEHAVDAAGGVDLGLAIADQELAQLEGVAGLHRRAELRRIGAVVAQLGLHRGRQEGVVLVENVRLVDARLDLLREVPAKAVGFRSRGPGHTR